MSVVAAVAAAVVVGTTAFFSDTETSQGNTFTAGAIDLTVDSHATYNGVAVPEATWTLKDLNPTSDKFFNFTDVKPGDVGEDTISLHVINNDAWVCAEVSNLVSNDNGLTEPESAVDQTGGAGQGELQNALMFNIWKDDGVNAGGQLVGTPCDNVQQVGEPTLLFGHPVNGVLPVYDLQHGGALAGGHTTCLGVSWNLPVGTGNEVQTDSLAGDISFRVEQARNNAGFVCSQVPVEKTLVLDNKDPQTWARIPDGMRGTLTYNTAGTNFTGTFQAAGLANKTNYSLIYYADRQDRFTNWGGDNPGAVIATFQTDGSGVIGLTAINTNLGVDMPAASDWNGTGAANYCAAPDNYLTCQGAKIWLVPTSDYDSGAKKLTAWNPASYLFETDLINYNDTDN